LPAELASGAPNPAIRTIAWSEEWMRRNKCHFWVSQRAKEQQKNDVFNFFGGLGKLGQLIVCDPGWRGDPPVLCAISSNLRFRFTYFICIYRMFTWGCICY
jgi:hypothetical protein